MTKRRPRRGAVAVEAALLMPVFISLVLFVMDMGLQAVTQVTMNSAVIAAARQMQMGAIRISSSQVVNLICSKMSDLADCSGSSLDPRGPFSVYVNSGSSFSALSPSAVSGRGLVYTTFTPGTNSSFVLLEVAYYSPWYVPLPGMNNKVLVSTIAFQNEP